MTMGGAVASYAFIDFIVIDHGVLLVVLYRHTGGRTQAPHGLEAPFAALV